MCFLANLNQGASMVTKTKAVKDNVIRPTVEGWYWYYPTKEEQKELTCNEQQVVRLYLTSEKMLVAEFMREIRRVTKLMGKWSKKLDPS
jgi:hypothetical protein